MSLDKIYTISCSLIEDLTSSSTLFSFETGSVTIQYCFFNRDISSSSPGCFKIYKSDANIKFCSFRECRASGGNEHFGNCFYCLENSCVFNNLCAHNCFTTTSIQAGDSVFVARLSKSIEAKYTNSTYCYSVDGTSSYSLIETTLCTIYVSFLNEVSGIDSNSLEFYSSTTIIVKTTNIINSTFNSRCVLFNYECSSSTFDNCVFMKAHSKFFGDDYSECHFNNCICDDTVTITGPTKYNYEYNLDFTIKIISECPQRILTHKYIYKFTYSINEFISIILLCSL